MNTNGRHTLLRAVVGVVLPLSLVVLTMLPLVLFRARLPEPLATHWGAGGRPNGTMTFSVLVVFNFVFVAVPATVMAVVARRDPAYRGEIAPAVAITSFMAAMAAIVSWLVVAANLDAANWSRAEPIGFAEIGLALVVAGAVATVATVLARSIETARVPEPVVPRAGLRPGTRAVWIGTARATWALLLVVSFVAGGIVMAIGLHPVLGLLFGLIGLAGLPFTSIRVIVDRHGLRIAYGAFGWPTQHVPLAEIRQASAITVRPMQWGGWGYRGTLRVAGRAAVVLRSGEGIQLDLDDDRVLVVTVDDAETGAGLVNDLVATPTVT